MSISDTLDVTRVAAVCPFVPSAVSSMVFACTIGTCGRALVEQNVESMRQLEALRAAAATARSSSLTAEVCYPRLKDYSLNMAFFSYCALDFNCPRLVAAP